MPLNTRIRAMALDRNKGPAADAPENKRRSKRKVTALPAMLTFQNMRITVPCMVADMSGSGAKLSFTAAVQESYGDLEHLPPRMMLVLLADKMQVDCEVVWRRAGKIGVRFKGPPLPYKR